MKKEAKVVAIIFIINLILILSTNIISAACTDTDATTQYPTGLNYNVKGTTNYNGVNYIDSSAITTSVNSGNTLVNQNKLDSNLDNYKDLI